MMKYIPGGVAAVLAFIALKIIGAFPFTRLWLEVIIFFAAYIVIAVAVERALRGYGTKKR